jgi:hypothetical protein
MAGEMSLLLWLPIELFLYIMEQFGVLEEQTFKETDAIIDLYVRSRWGRRGDDIIEYLKWRLIYKRPRYARYMHDIELGKVQGYNDLMLFGGLAQYECEYNSGKEYNFVPHYYCIVSRTCVFRCDCKRCREQGNTHLYKITGTDVYYSHRHLSWDLYDYPYEQTEPLKITPLGKWDPSGNGIEVGLKLYQREIMRLECDLIDGDTIMDEYDSDRTNVSKEILDYHDNPPDPTVEKSTHYKDSRVERKGVKRHRDAKRKNVERQRKSLQRELKLKQQNVEGCSGRNYRKSARTHKRVIKGV